MTWSPGASITGGAQTGFTTPGYTLTADLAPSAVSRQQIVSALTGTQTGVNAHTISKPFTITFTKPANPRILPAANPVTGLRGAIPMNQYKLIVRKGGDVAAGVPAVAVCRVTFDIPAGMDTYSAAEIRGLASLLVGLLSSESQDLGDTLVTGNVA